MGDMMTYRLLHGDNREQLKHLADNSIDSIVCDPPYELGFMGKRWDSTGIAYDVTVWTECLRVLKPGGHLIAFGGTRTYHRMTVAIEDAGFEIRDCIMWLYGSGFPKSLDVSKALDKQAGAERTEYFKKPIAYPDSDCWSTPNKNSKGNNIGFDTQGAGNRKDMDGHGNIISSLPATDLAKQWHGYGTSLKPAVEPAVLARKPLIGTVADNVTTWGVGAINIDGCRIETTDDFGRGGERERVRGYVGIKSSEMIPAQPASPLGRWPANVILDESAGEALDAQSGWSSGVRKTSTITTQVSSKFANPTTTQRHSDSGGASRFFYTAKASKSEREAGLNAPDGQRANGHPTIKPIALMRYLVRLVTPKGGTVLDPFMGSGSTGCAAMCEGVNFVGIELSEEYLEIARRRIAYWQSQNPMGL